MTSPETEKYPKRMAKRNATIREPYMGSWLEIFTFHIMSHEVTSGLTWIVSIPAFTMKFTGVLHARGLRIIDR